MRNPLFLFILFQVQMLYSQSPITLNYAPMKHEKQALSQLCWAATISMLTDYLNPTYKISQCQQLTDRGGAICCNLDAACEKCNIPDTLYKKFNQYEIDFKSYGKCFSLQEIKEQMSMQKPMVQALVANENAHFFLIKGVSEAKENNAWLLIDDPLLEQESILSYRTYSAGYFFYKNDGCFGNISFRNSDSITKIPPPPLQISLPIQSQGYTSIYEAVDTINKYLFQESNKNLRDYLKISNIHTNAFSTSKIQSGDLVDISINGVENIFDETAANNSNEIIVAQVGINTCIYQIFLIKENDLYFVIEIGNNLINNQSTFPTRQLPNAIIYLPENKQFIYQYTGSFGAKNYYIDGVKLTQNNINNIF